VPCPDDVVIRGGTISGFATAIDALCSPLGGSGNRISAMRLIDNEWGIASQQIALDVDHTTIEGTNGIGSRSSGELRLRRLRIDVTGTSVQSAGTSMPTTIDASRLTGGTLETDLNSTTVSRSVLDGVTIECFTAALAISDTRVVGGGGIWGQECANDLVRDRFSGPGSGTAVSDAGSEPWTITDSRFTGWDLAIALGGDPSTITSNVFRRNGAGVICATGQCAGVSGTVSGNWFIDNRGAGLSLSDGTWHVGSNRAERNGGLGIDAEGPDLTVIDDGGNIARRNQPPQCVGVVCAT